MPRPAIRLLVATLLSAGLYAASFPPLGWSALAWVALVPFLVAVSTLSPGRAAAWGLLLGFVGAYGLAWWFPGMVASYFGVPLAAGLAAFVVVGIVFAAVYMAAFAAWVAWLAARGLAGPLAIAAGWGALELVRARLLVGNPWGLFGYSQAGWPRLVQIADVSGPYGVGLLLVAVNACLAGLLARQLRGSRFGLSTAAVATALVGTLVYGGWRLAEPFAVGEPVTVAVVQDAIAREGRRGPGARARVLERYLELTQAAAAGRPGLVVWPENAVDFYLQETSAERDTVLGTFRALGTDLILGGPSYDIGADGPRYHNSVFLVRAGLLAGRYDKLHLLPFAEQRLDGESYAPGRLPYALRAGAGLVGAFVCFEAMYPELVRRIATGGAEVLANLSNDAWFGHDAPAQHHLDIAALRAVENRRYLVRATTTGFSAVIDPHGRVVARSRLGSPGVLSEPVRRSRARTPYQRMGDAVAWAAVALALAITLRALSKGERP